MQQSRLIPAIGAFSGANLFHDQSYRSFILIYQEVMPMV
jgi:hypothetical protein